MAKSVSGQCFVEVHQPVLRFAMAWTSFAEFSPAPASLGKKPSKSPGHAFEAFITCGPAKT